MLSEGTLELRVHCVVLIVHILLLAMVISLFMVIIIQEHHKSVDSTHYDTYWFSIVSSMPFIALFASWHRCNRLSNLIFIFKTYSFLHFS